jgi:Tol biopolymer transport system component
MKTIRIALVAAVLAVLGGGLVFTQSGQDLFQQALVKERADGDLRAAIVIYQRIVRDFAADRTLAAKALVQMGRCYEKLGTAEMSEARKAYERVVREFADQKDAVEQARALLAARGVERPPTTGVTEQQVWALSDPPRLRYVASPSSDGRYLPFIDNAATYISLHELSTGQNRVIAGKEPGFFFAGPVVSPDGRQVAYTRFRRPPFSGSDFEMRVANIDGSEPRVLVTRKEGWIWPLGWSPDGRQLLAGTQGSPAGLSLVRIADGSARALGADGDYSNGCFSPDGKYVVTYRAPLPESPTVRPPGALKLQPVDGGRAIPLFESQSSNWWAFWTPDGRRIVFLSDRSGTTSLWSIRMMNDRPEGEPELLRRNVGDMQPLGFTRDGTFYHKTPRDSDWNIYRVDLDPATGQAVSKPERINQRFVGSVGLPVEWSPDGETVAYTGVVEHTTVSLVLRSERSGDEREVKLGRPFPRGYAVVELQWFPDQRAVLAQVMGNSTRESSFWRVDVQTGEVAPLLDLTARNEGVYYPALSRDGKTLFYLQTASPKDPDRLMRRDLATGEVKELYRADWIEHLLVSADGRQLQFEGSYQDQNTMSLLTMPADGGVPREMYRSKNYIADHISSRDGGRVWMVPSTKAGHELWSIPTGGGEPQPSGLVRSGMYSLSLRPDGGRMAFSSGEAVGESVWAIRNLLPAAPAARK